ncbi:hypothetical protein EDC94DRAFT_586121 [Helicostylum pulchrum]|nr:hypothetical protein EDC94DRAFT_586121 [Helicostylum pulchrum]
MTHHVVSKDLTRCLVLTVVNRKRKYSLQKHIAVIGTETQSLYVPRPCECSCIRCYAPQNDVSADFNNTPFAYIKQISCNYWADKYYFVDQNALTAGDKTIPLSPLMAIAYFFSTQKTFLLSTDYSTDPTLQNLYTIAKEQVTTNVSDEKSIGGALADVCNQTNNILHDIEPMPETILKKRFRAYADGGVSYTRTRKPKYFKRSDDSVEPMPPPPGGLSTEAKSSAEVTEAAYANIRSFSLGLS